MKAFHTKRIAKEVQHEFAFLFDRGYTIHKIRYTPEAFGNWDATLESLKCRIIISQDRDQILVSLAPVEAEAYPRVGLEPVIYFLSNRAIFIEDFPGNPSKEKREQFSRLRTLLMQYIDEIESLFGTDFAARRDELLAIQREFNEILVKKAGNFRRDAG
jgi:hypothetical protein